jgi:hypothetical protein
MARTHEDLERYIMNGLIPFEQIGETTWLLNDPSWEGAQIVVQHTDPLVVFRCKLFDVPKMGAEAELSLYKTLLRLNATEMLQGAYALENGAVVAVEVMQLQNLDENEFVAAIDSLTLAITEHRDEVVALLPKA